MFCASLQEVYTPPALQRTAHRAFFDCEQLTQLIKVDDKTTWRGPYAENNTFALCAKFRRPTWINMLPPDGDDSDAFDEELHKDVHQQPTPGTSVSVLLGGQDPAAFTEEQHRGGQVS